MKRELMSKGVHGETIVSRLIKQSYYPQPVRQSVRTTKAAPFDIQDYGILDDTLANVVITEDGNAVATQ
jgi:hypothetical protein